MKREIICNTGPILGLAIIGRLDLFRDLFDNVFVPEEVHDEILEGGVKEVGLGSYKKAEWINRSMCSRSRKTAGPRPVA